MAEGEKTGKAAQSERRRQRLAAELRSNLVKRKEQARQRSADGRRGQGADRGAEKGKSEP
jgi:hypothetical protein